MQPLPQILQVSSCWHVKDWNVPNFRFIIFCQSLQHSLFPLDLPCIILNSGFHVAYHLQLKPSLGQTLAFLGYFKNWDLDLIASVLPFQPLQNEMRVLLEQLISFTSNKQLGWCDNLHHLACKRHIINFFPLSPILVLTFEQNKCKIRVHKTLTSQIMYFLKAFSLVNC